MKVEFIKKNEIGASKYGPYFTIDDVLKLYDEELIDKHEARTMLSYITKVGWLAYDL